MPAALIALWCLLVGIICRVLVWLLSLTEKALLTPADGEPPLVQSPIPFIGHIIGLVRYGVSYYRQLREQNPRPIFTIWLAKQKIYVVNSPALVSQINRRQQQIDSNPPFLAVVMGGLFGLHGENLAELLRNPSASGSLRNDSKVVEHSHLERGTASLNDLFNGLMAHVVSKIGDLGAQADSAATVSLERWLRDTLTASVAYGVFGNNNPLDQDPGLYAEFWTFEKGMKELVIGFLPSLTAAGPARARQRLTEAFAQFVQDESAVEGASELIRALRRVAMAHDRDAEYLARYLLALFSAFILNTVPVAFWTLAHIYNDSTLLRQIRGELDHVVRKTTTAEGRIQLDLDMPAIRAQKCPLFTSTFREVLRYVGASRGIMVVHEDVWIESHQERYLLRKGAQVQIAATAIHADPEIWGVDAATFDPGRFLPETALRGKDKVHPAAHRTFGGGSTLCPGRHLATDEVLALAAMFLTSFDMEPVDGDNSLLPSRNERDMTPIVKPMSDIKVRLSRRATMENILWSWKPTN